MSYKKWGISLIVIILLLLILFGTVTFIVDPLCRYRGEDNGFTSYYTHVEIYGNPGVAKNYKYDSVLVGTSMLQNTDIDEIDKLFDCNMVKLTYSGGTAHNMKTILDVCFESDNDIKLVYWGLDEFQMFANYNETTYPLPEYLYQNNHLKDIEYLLNADIFYHYTLKSLYHSFLGHTSSALSKGDMWSKSSTFGKDAVLSTYTPPKKSEQQSTDFYNENLKLNLEYNILPLIEENPNTKFIFSFVPYSVLYWYTELQKGTFDASTKALNNAIETLLSYDNVELHYFRNEFDITTNLDNYKDYTHYHKDINSFMTNAIAKGEHRLTKENYKEQLNQFSDFIESYDFEKLLAN